eukprot:SAG11_NODE_4518_length_1866_cov_2.148274_2_plen_67_part_00
MQDDEVDRLYLLISISSIISRVLGGYLLDKTSERFVMAFGMFIQAWGMVGPPPSEHSNSNHRHNSY